jgi:protein ImuB
MRVAAVHLPELRVEVLRASSASCGVLAATPLAIVVAPAPMTEQKLLGNMRLDVVSREARALGVREGHTIAQARARAGDLAVRVVRPDAVREVLAHLAEVLLAFGATVSFSFCEEGEGSFGDVVWVDVTGCAHLHAPDRHEGERILASRIRAAMASLGHVCAVAIADGPRVAAILARAASLSGSPETIPPLVVPPGQNAAALSRLPIAALPLGADDVRWLTKVGVATIDDLRALPRSALATRLGARAAVVLSLADGDDRAPLAPYVPPEVPEEEAALEYGIDGTEALLFVAKTLVDRLAARLAGRAVAATRVELDLTLDRAMLADAAGERGRDDGEAGRPRVALDLPSPLSSASDLLAALRPKIERLVLAAPVLAAKLRAPVLVHKPQAALALFEAQPKADRALPRLVAELAADLGEEAVGKLALGDAWSPEDRSRFVRLSAQRDLPLGRKPRHLLSSVPEPTRILAEPMPIARKDLEIVRHLARLEHVEWWKRIPGAEGHMKRSADYVMAFCEEGTAWVEIDRGTGAARVRGWFD